MTSSTILAIYRLFAMNYEGSKEILSDCFFFGKTAVTAFSLSEFSTSSGV